MMRNLKLYGFLVSLMVTIMLICDALAFKIVSIYGHNFAASGLIFPVSFLLACIVTEVYGYNLAARIIWFQVSCQVLFIFVINIFATFPSNLHSNISLLYFNLYKNFWHVLLASSIAVPLAYFATDFIMSKFKIKMYGNFFYLRYLLSNFVGKGILVIISYPINFYEQLNFFEIYHLALNTFIYKMIMAILLTPVALFLAFLIKKIEKLDFYDYGTSYNPIYVFDSAQKGKNLYGMKKNEQRSH
jgi:uncharacterized PurR-regulated membrane protein YhhQ (DUF165 family)